MLCSACGRPAGSIAADIHFPPGDAPAVVAGYRLERGAGAADHRLDVIDICGYRLPGCREGILFRVVRMALDTIHDKIGRMREYNGDPV